MLVPKGVRAGKISKPYGLRGELNIILEPLAGNYIEPDDPLFIEIDGQRVPFFVEEVEMISTGQAIIKFEFIDSLEEARKFTGSPLYFDHRHHTDRVEKGENLSYLVGYMAVDKELGPLGKISDYLPNPLNPIFLIQSENKELMVPAVMDFIEHIDSGMQTVRFILPEGISAL